MTASMDFHELQTWAIELRGVQAQIFHRAELAVRKTAFDIERYAKEIVAVDTGYLKSTISTDFEKSKNQFIAHIGPTANYGIFVELGTSRMRPQPYMRPATEKYTPAFMRAAEILSAEFVRTR
jgi:HK97 gp10 family phage protein